jgi:hypothetical protein
MIKELNKRSLLFGFPGILLQIIALFFYFGDGRWDCAYLLAWLGVALLIIALCYYAKAKGYPGFVGLLGILGIIGVIILYFLKDKNKT